MNRLDVTLGMKPEESLLLRLVENNRQDDVTQELIQNVLKSVQDNPSIDIQGLRSQRNKEILNA